MRAWLLLALLLAGCARPSRPARLVPYGPPSPGAATSSDIVLDHGALRIVFSADHKSARYARYTLTAQNLRDRYIKRDRSDPFAKDPLLSAKGKGLALEPRAYARSGFDRGHLVPAEDLTWSEDGYFATFYMSNMSPQEPRLNQKAWKELEEWARDAACGEEKVTVITGPVLRQGLLWLKGDRSSTVVPEEYFKLVVDETPPRKAVAFLFTQKDQDKGLLRKRAVLPAVVEEKTGIDFSGEISDAKELFRGAKASLEGWKLRDEAVFCPQKRDQVLASELKKQRAEPRIPAGRR